MNVNDQAAQAMLSMQLGAYRVGRQAAERALEPLSSLEDDARRRDMRRSARDAGSLVEEEMQQWADKRLRDVARRLAKATGKEVTIPSRPGSLTIMRGSVADRMYDSASAAATPSQLRAYVRSVTRSGFNAAHNAAVLAVARANRGTIDGVMALATLDNRLSDICRSRHGGAWDITTGDPLAWSATSIKFPGRPPWHFNCRTVLTPVFGGEDLPTDEVLDWETWLETDEASKILDPTRLKLYRSGKMTATQLLSGPR